MDAQSLRTLIQQTLTPFDLYSRNAEELLMATAANESHLGQFRKQIGGPAIGIFQEEPEDFNDLYANFLHYHPVLLEQANSLSSSKTVDDLENNDPYAVMICRLHYYRKPGDLPDANDIEAIWDYYKQNYNSEDGAANHDTFISCYNRYVREL